MKDVLLLTGTPGTGKTTVAGLFSKMSGFRVVAVNDVVGEDYLYIESGSRVVDLPRLSLKIRQMLHERCVVEGHLSHLLGIDARVVVLRCHPDELEKRLVKKGFKGRKLEENLEAEALDVCLVESVERYEHVYEIDTTGKGPEAVAESIQMIIRGDDEGFRPGGVSWLEEYYKSSSREA